ncbi:hypothetical protein R1sor_021999 [Riccia sorocarpa]|uniref:Uncharacterized protein n=1 Tax=Riccia sorocarpa TaxID=122646 RepID=A0ABD3GJB4_9MARC
MADFVPPRRSTSLRRNGSSREQQIFPVPEPGDRGSAPIAASRASTDSNSSASAGSRRFHSQSLLQRSNSASVAAIQQAIAAEVANAEANLDPTELLPEALGDWRDRSMGVQMLKRNQTLRTSKRSTVYFVEDDKAVLAVVGATDGKVDKEKDKQVDLPEDFYAALNVAPQATLVHLVRLYHKTLAEHGLEGEAEKIADMLAELEAVEEEIEEELTGVDLLLKNRLLKYLMRIQPYLPPIPPQVVHFKNVNCTVTVQVDPGYESI